MTKDVKRLFEAMKGHGLVVVNWSKSNYGV